MAWDEVLLAFQIVKNYSSVQEKEGGLVGNYTIDKKRSVTVKEEILCHNLFTIIYKSLQEIC